MFAGYPLRKYRVLDWLLIFLTSALVLQFVMIQLLSKMTQAFPDIFYPNIYTNEELLSTILRDSSFLGTILSLPLTLFVVYLRKIPFFNRKHLSKKESVLIRGLNKKDWHFLVRYIPISYGLYLLGSGLVVSIFGEADAVNQLAIESLFEYMPLWQLFLMIVIAAPIVEELLFRGLILFSNGKIETTWMRVIISAVLFGAAHSPTNIQSFYTYVGMGLILAYAAKRTKSIEAPIIYHILNNLVGFITLVLLAQ